MKLLEGITKRKNRSKLYLLLITFCLLFFSSYIYYNTQLTENQNSLFNKLNELNLKYTNYNLPKLSNLLNSEIYNDKCIYNDQVISCEKINYDNLWFLGKYNLEISNINDKINYKIIKNDKNLFIIFLELIFFISISLYLTYYILKLIFFIKIKFSKDLKSEFELIEDEWDKIKEEKKEYEKFIKDGDNSFKKKLDDLKRKEKEFLEKERNSTKTGDDSWLRKRIYNELVKYYHPDKGNTTSSDLFREIQTSYKTNDDTKLYEIYKKYLNENQSNKNNTTTESDTKIKNIEIHFDRSDKDYQNKKIEKIEEQIELFDKVKINGNYYILNSKGYLKYEKDKPHTEKLLHRIIAKKKLYHKSVLNNINFSNLEVHHIKYDQKLNCFEDNLFIVTKEEHNLIHKKLISKYGEIKAVNIIKENRNSIIIENKKIKKDLNNIYYFFDYYPQNSDPNNIYESERKKILGAKNNSFNLINNYLSLYENSINLNKELTLCSVPSSKKGAGINSFGEFIKKLSKNKANIIDGSSVIYRIKDVEKKHLAINRRSEQDERDSIKIKHQNLIKNKIVILLDDITTKGESLKVNEKLLLENGAKEVYCIALAKTTHK